MQSMLPGISGCLGFGPETQRGLLARLGIDRPGPRQLMYATLAACLLFLAWLVWQLRPAGKALRRSGGATVCQILRPACPGVPAQAPD